MAQHPSHLASRRLRAALSPLRVAGLVGIAVVALRGAAGAGTPTDALAILLGALPLAAFLWLVLTGWFGYGSARRSDAVAAIPFVIALIVREIFTLHSVQEIEIQFARGPVGRHSVVYPLLQMFFEPLVRDRHVFTMHLNAVLGALACPALYLFVRNRLDSRTAGFLCALFLATHPLVARFSPTDGPYSLLLVTWFAGLALLSARALDARAMIGGAALLGIAATSRMEGMVLLAASLLLLDHRVLTAAIRRYRGAAVLAVVAIAGQAAVQMTFLLPFHLGGPTPLTALIPPPGLLYFDAVWPVPYNHPLFTRLMWIGAVAGLSRRFRLGLRAYVAMLVVLAPVADSVWTTIAFHRLVPACALQTIVAGVGATVLTAWLPLAGSMWRWVAAVPGTIAALSILVAQSGDLTKPYVFTEEYGLVRSHLAPRGHTVSDCTLLTFNAIAAEDVDIHDFRQVVPDMRVLDCGTDDCLTAVAGGGCFYYVRSAVSYFHASGVPAECAATGATAAGGIGACLGAAPASFEQSVELQPIDIRTIDILETFPDRRWQYPVRAQIGLFRVEGRRGT